MDRKTMFNNFASVSESEMLNAIQMQALEAGGSCEAGCKKSCKPGNQNIKETHPYVLSMGEAQDLKY